MNAIFRKNLHRCANERLLENYSELTGEIITVYWTMWYVIV